MNDLVNRKTVLQELAPMLLGPHTHFGKNGICTARRTRHPAAFARLGGLLRLQGLDDLVEKEGDPMVQLCFGCPRRGPLSDLQPASLNQFTPIFD